MESKEDHLAYTSTRNAALKETNCSHAISWAKGIFSQIINYKNLL